MEKTERVQNKSYTKNRRLLFTVTLCAAMFFAAHLAASFLVTGKTWGFHHWMFFPLPVRILFFFGILICVPQVNRYIVQRISPAVSNLSSRIERVNKYSVATFLACFSFVIFWFLRSRTHFLGDGYIRIRSITVGNKFIWAEPLDSHLHYTVYTILNSSFGWTADVTYALVSCFIGSLFVFVAVLGSYFLAKDFSRRVFIFLSLSFMGSVQLFFGYVEDYTLLLFVIFVYILISILYLRKGCSIFFPSFVLSIAICTHTSAMIFVPSLLYLLLRKVQKDQSWKHYMVSLGKMLVGFMIPITLLLFRVHHVGFSLDNFREAFTEGSHILPLVGNTDSPEAFPYGLFSLTHFLSMVNEILLLAPIGFIIGITHIFIKRRKKDSGDHVPLFLLGLTVLCCVYLFLLKPDKGASRDWDLFAMCSIPWTMYGVYLFINYSLNKEKFLRIALILITVGFLHTFPWILVNAAEKTSLERFDTLIENDNSLDNIALADAYDELSTFYAKRNMQSERIFYCEKAAKALPTSRYNNNLGAAYVDNAMYNQAISVLKKIDDSTPYAADAHYNMGLAYTKLDRLHEAVSENQKAIEMNPRNAKAYHNLAHALLRMNKLRQALSALKKADQLNPNDLSTIYNIGVAYLHLEEMQEAIPYFQKALQLNPNHPGSHFNLGVISFKLNKFQDALRKFQRVSQLKPKDEESHYNMGLTYLKLENQTEAMTEFQKVLAMNPHHQDAKVMMERLRVQSQKNE